MIRRTRIKAKRSKPRRGPLRDKGYRGWLTKQACLICAGFMREQTTVTDPAHTVNNGMSSKGADSSCVPLCRIHHNEYDAGRALFETKYDVNMQRIAASYWKDYQQEKAA